MCPDLGSLLCAGEVATALGEAVRPPTCAPLGPTTQICRWRSATGRGSLTVTMIAARLAAHTLSAERRLGLTVEGLGDEAYLRAGQVCVVRRGERVLKLVLSGSRVHDPAGAVVRLAGLAADRLERPTDPARSATGPGLPR